MIKVLIFSTFILLSNNLIVFAGGEENIDDFFNKETVELRLNQIDQALSEFSIFTDLFKNNSNLESQHGISALYVNKIPDNAEIKISLIGHDIKTFKTLDWDMQNIGFENWTKFVEGYIEFQNLRLLKKEHELLMLKGSSKEKISKIKNEIVTKEKLLKNKYLEENSFID